MENVFIIDDRMMDILRHVATCPVCKKLPTITRTPVKGYDGQFRWTIGCGECPYEFKQHRDGISGESALLDVGALSNVVEDWNEFARPKISVRNGSPMHQLDDPLDQKHVSFPDSDYRDDRGPMEAMT